MPTGSLPLDDFLVSDRAGLKGRDSRERCDLIGQKHPNQPGKGGQRHRTLKSRYTIMRFGAGFCEVLRPKIGITTPFWMIPVPPLAMNMPPLVSGASLRQRYIMQIAFDRPTCLAKRRVRPFAQSWPTAPKAVSRLAQMRGHRRVYAAIGDAIYNRPRPSTDRAHEIMSYRIERLETI